MNPALACYPRDMDRIVRPCSACATPATPLVVVEHDPAVMLAADRMIRHGPGPAERGGSIVFGGSTEALRRADTLTGAYLGGRKRAWALAEAPGQCRSTAPDFGRLRHRAQPAERAGGAPAAVIASRGERFRASPRWCRILLARRFDSSARPLKRRARSTAWGPSS